MSGENEERNALYLFRKETGEKVFVANLRNGEALWTVDLATDNLVYYIDEDEEGNKVLYQVALGDVNMARAIKTFSTSEFNVDLSRCSSEISDGVLYLFSIENDTDLTMQFRYEY